MVPHASVLLSVLLAFATISSPVRAGAAPAGVTSIVPADLPDELVDGTGWSKPTKVDDRPVRIAKGGKDAWLRAKPWWAGGARPADGQYWTIEVFYKDTADQPILFRAFSNTARNGGRTELHRFGGLKDGKWKTAAIPLGADMVMARPVIHLVEFSVQSAGGDVPVASIRLAPLPADQLGEAAARYNEQTREWVARAQEPRRNAPRNEFDQPQTPATIVTESKAAVIGYVRSYLQVIYPYSAPQDGEINRPLEATMALNEYEPAAFGVYANGQDLTNVRVLVTPMQNLANADARLEATVQTAEFALVPNGTRAPVGAAASATASQSASAAAGDVACAVFPQRLWPMYPTRIQKGQSGWFWITFRSDPKVTVPGAYRGKVTITADQGNAVLPVSVRVLPFPLLDMQEADLRMGGCVTGLLPRHEMEAMLRHNHNMINLWLSGVAPTILPKGQDDFELDFTLMDDFMAQARAAGILTNVWFLGGNPYGFPMTVSLERALATEVLGLTREQYSQLIDRDRMNIPPRIVPLYRKWVAKVMQHAEETGWPEQILTPFDEPAKWVQQPGRKAGADSGDPNVMGTGPWIKPHFEQSCKLIHESSPGTRIYGSIHHAEPGLVFLKDVDVFCTNAIHEDSALGDKVRAADKVFWQYANITNAMPGRGRYAFGFFFNAFGSRGSLCWAYNWGPRFDTTAGGESWQYAWYTPLDTIPSPFYEAVREAWDDRRYIETLKHVAGRNNVDIREFLADLAEQGRSLCDEDGRNRVNYFRTDARRIKAMDDLRARVVTRILEIRRGGATATQSSR